MVKHVCVAAKIGDGEAPGAANIGNIRQTSNDVSAGFGRNPVTKVESKLDFCCVLEGKELR